MSVHPASTCILSCTHTQMYHSSPRNPPHRPVCNCFLLQIQTEWDVFFAVNHGLFLSYPLELLHWHRSYHITSMEQPCGMWINGSHLPRNDDMRTKSVTTPPAYSHYNDVIMSASASQITSIMSVYSTVYSGADQRKHQNSVSLAFVRGIHRWPVNSPHKWPVTRKMFPFDDVIMHGTYCITTHNNSHTLIFQKSLQVYACDVIAIRA